MELRHWWSFYRRRPSQERRRADRTKCKQIARAHDRGDSPLFQYLYCPSKVISGTPLTRRSRSDAPYLRKLSLRTAVVPSTNWLFGGPRVVLTHGDTANHENRENWAK